MFMEWQVTSWNFISHLIYRTSFVELWYISNLLQGVGTTLLFINIHLARTTCRLFRHHPVLVM
jgi:hypothetical protein